MLSNSFSWSFLKDLWALSLVFPWVSLFYFLQTLERLPPKYASINGRLYFSQIVFRSCSSTYKNSLTYFCRGFLFRDITSKMLKNVSLFPPFIFVSHIGFLRCAACQRLLFLRGNLLHLAVSTFTLFEISFQFRETPFSVWSFICSLLFYSQSLVLNRCLYSLEKLYRPALAAAGAIRSDTEPKCNLAPVLSSQREYHGQGQGCSPAASRTCFLAFLEANILS